MEDLISRAAAQTELQSSARRYMVSHEAHGEGQVVWSESLISVSDAMDVLRKIPSAQPTFDARDTQYNLPIGTDLISRTQAIEVVQKRHMMLSKEKVLLINDLEKLPSAQPEVKQISYTDCANAMLMMWMDKVLTDGEYNRIMDKLNEHEKKKGKDNG